MPLFDYACQECGQQSELLVSGSRQTKVSRMRQHALEQTAADRRRPQPRRRRFAEPQYRFRVLWHRLWLSPARVVTILPRNIRRKPNPKPPLGRHRQKLTLILPRAYTEFRLYHAIFAAARQTRFATERRRSLLFAAAGITS